MIFSWCQKCGLADDVCQDATQEVLLKLLTILKEFEYDSSKGSFRAWLKTVTSNLARDIKRAAKPGNTGSGDTGIIQLLNQIKDENSWAQLSRIFEQQYDDELLAIASQEVRKRVSEKNWEAWLAYAVEQKNARDVADQLKIPIAEVYVAKSRILKMLQTEIERLESDFA